MKKCFALMVGLVVLIVPLLEGKSFAAGGITLYTPYTGITVTPGETITYEMDLINATENVQQVSFRLDGVPEDWDYEITSSGRSVQEIAVKPQAEQAFTLDVEVPLQVQKGEYHFSVVTMSSSGITDKIPLSVVVSEKGVFKTELTTEQANMEGSSDSTFRYKLTLKNRTAQEQTYALVAEVERGWDVKFEVDGKSVTSITVDSNAEKDITTVITPPSQVKSGIYPVPIMATNNSTSSEVTLEAAVTGTYDMNLTTPSGRLSEDVTAGGEKTIELVVENTGTSELRDISLKASQPIGWKVTFDPSEIKKIEPGQSEKVMATISASDQAIAGDYIVDISSQTPEASGTATFRMQVETSMFVGWVAILIMLAVVAAIVYVMRKYGRR
ncbi:NEW3 domain-containing protein [Bacillus salitolerans]|uniref:NEW3 domain-containing protein n=1 Tax=Bacillus salitolerans TaxID=1437434 RepID=A0ABW4LS32_9BACI